MQRKGSSSAFRSPGSKLVTIGVDMGGSLWATAIHDWETGRDSYYPFRDKPNMTKESQLFGKVSEHVKEGREVEVFYEAGRYGYWPAREMMNLGAKAHILPVNKLVVIMSGKKIKTDKLDAKFLSEMHPEDKLLEVHIPTPEEEGCRDAVREMERLSKETRRLNAQLIAVLERTPIPTPSGHHNSVEWRRLLVELGKQGKLERIPKMMALRMGNMIDELELVERHEKSWKQVVADKEKADNESADAARRTRALTLAKLASFKGIGGVISRHLAWEIGSFERFGSGKQFTSYFGLTPCPYSSGTMNKNLGISKKGRMSLRRMAIELGWLWTKWQPDSWMTRKWSERLKVKGRQRRTAIVALARQLLVSLWHFVVKGEAIEGAIINKPLAHAGL